MVIALQLLLIILKLSGTVAWSWGLILLPALSALSIVGIYFSFFFLSALAEAWVDS